MRFKDRMEAGKRLATALNKYRDEDGIVYPLPRGGIPVGVEIAKALHMPLDLIIPRKIGHPFNPEYAIGAVSENGDMVCNEWELSQIDQQWFQERVKRERQESRRRREQYLRGRPPLPAAGKTVILVDDGIATGLTMRAAIRDARHRHPAYIVVAIPVAPKDTAALLKQEVDDVVVLHIPDFYLGAVGTYYYDFCQVTHEEAIKLLQLAETSTRRQRRERPTIG